MVAEKNTGCVVNAQTICSSPLGQELSEAQCARLVDIATARCLKKGDFLLEEGRQDDALHVVVSGRLEVVKQTGNGDWISLQILQPGDLVGALGFIDGVGHSAGIRALENCELFSLPREPFEGLLREDPDLVYRVMRAIVRMVHGILGRMNMHFVEMSNYITHQHGRY